jgi:MFS family permease
MIGSMRIPGLALGRFHRDARWFLLTSLISGAALSLYWIDFNLYLASLGLSTSTIGLIATISSTAGAIVAFPASALSDRLGRRAVIGAGFAIGPVALLGLIVSTDALPIAVFASLWSIGWQAVQVVQAPYLTEHSDADHRNELFALQFAIQNVTNIAAAILGLQPGGPGTYRVILVLMIALLVAALVTITRLRDDRPERVTRRRIRAAGEPAVFPPDPRRSRARFGLVVVDRSRFIRLVLPSFLVSLGAGQVIPFLNLYVQRRFGLDLASLNAVFAVTSLGTVLAILAQPRLARRFGQITSVVIVQAASIPFLVVLGFSPFLWTVIAAMTVRNALMNAGNPIFTAFAMERVTPVERATLSAALTVLWQVGWVLGGSWYAFLQATVGFDTGYAINFVAVITLYSVATALSWIWFRAIDRQVLAAAA